MIKRRFLNTLYKGKGSQFLYLLLICLIILGSLTLISYLVFNDGSLVWQDVVALFLDPGVFAGHGEHDIFRLIIALMGVFSFSSILISFFTNLISNIAEAFKNGEVHFQFKNHILIIGAGEQLEGMLREIFIDGKKNDVVILTDESVSEIRVKLEHSLGNFKVADKVTFLKGNCTGGKDLNSCYPWRAESIYVLGDSSTSEHDSRNIRCADMLRELCNKAKHDIRCFVMLDDDLSSAVFRYVTYKSESSPLKIDFIPSYEYQAEQLLVYSDFLPIIKADSDIHSHIVVFGKSRIAKAVVNIAAHISHYQNYKNGKNRTVITLVAPDIREYMESAVLSKHSLFDLCHWSYMSENQEEKHSPLPQMGDYIDIEFQFVDARPDSLFVNSLIGDWASDDRQILSLISASDSVSDNLEWMLTLSRRVHSSSMAVYLPCESGLFNVALRTGMFGNIVSFGSASSYGDALCRKRSERARRVNFIYDKAFDRPSSANADEAWLKISEAHKFSSVYCADGMTMIKRCSDFTADRMSIYETEHRRWMVSVLLMGYTALPLVESALARTDRERIKVLKAAFVHPDIAPFEDLPEEDKYKDAILIDAIDEIIR